MSHSVYTINKGINRPLVFKGLKAQYIWYLGAGLLTLLLLFAILYISGLNPFVCLLLIGLLGTALFLTVYHLSHKYGAYGLQKTMARKSIPQRVLNKSRKPFLQLWKKN